MGKPILWGNESMWLPPKVMEALGKLPENHYAQVEYDWEEDDNLIRVTKWYINGTITCTTTDKVTK